MATTPALPVRAGAKQRATSHPEKGAAMTHNAEARLAEQTRCPPALGSKPRAQRHASKSAGSPLSKRGSLRSNRESCTFSLPPFLGPVPPQGSAHTLTLWSLEQVAIRRPWKSKETSWMRSLWSAGMWRATNMASVRPRLLDLPLPPPKRAAAAARRLQPTGTPPPTGCARRVARAPRSRASRPFTRHAPRGRGEGDCACAA